MDELISGSGAELTRPAHEFHGHLANVFHAVLDADERFLISCGSDGYVYRHDVESESTLPLDRLAGHEDAVHRVSLHPNQTSVVLSAGDDGTVKLWDLRKPARDVGTLDMFVTVNCAAFHPDHRPYMFTVSGSDGCLATWDMRTAFASRVGDMSATPNARRKRKRADREPLFEYHTGTAHTIGAFALSPDGESLVTLEIQSGPSLWSATSPRKFATFQHPYPTPPTHVPATVPYHLSSTPDVAHSRFGFHARGYQHHVTHKAPAWHPTGAVVASGSDDFGVYLWRIPTALDELVEVPRATHVLHGHHSIVNRVAFHPDWPVMVSCGIESHVLMHSPGYLGGCGRGEPKGVPPPRVQRALMASEVVDWEGRVTDTEDLQVALMFDRLLVHSHMCRDAEEDSDGGWVTDDGGSEGDSDEEEQGSGGSGGESDGEDESEMENQ
ncbi:hypothetical protein AMAG_08324 [Allomyces macrogynus ATCC 38327]|uniref:Uncharacterized protein n=1 Tax=Allomyces macrogynus (strain ATCC 38327) TaxID=578462 RepID=A0A0L0SLA5_ALLM3|nr:hypothetical protein AMAG_08324 [Allomyces macrogynus ATCC 38327]|eukprot:KNE63169.1 hypothetical protein AMAG_08324 [Allomyces macrogynus ATCC 38327]